MTVLRNLLAIAIASLGTIYAVRGTLALMSLSDVTNRWIQLSGDPDFRFDADLFRALIGSGAAAVLLFGLATAACGVRTAMGRAGTSKYWTGLAIAAPLIHFPWFTYRVIATGKRAGWQSSVRWNAICFIAVCAAYVLAWALTRRQPGTSH
jgi:hypothetical protein